MFFSKLFYSIDRIVIGFIKRCVLLIPVFLYRVTRSQVNTLECNEIIQNIHINNFYSLSNQYCIYTTKLIFNRKILWDYYNTRIKDAPKWSWKEIIRLLVVKSTMKFINRRSGRLRQVWTISYIDIQDLVVKCQRRNSI